MSRAGEGVTKDIVVAKLKSNIEFIFLIPVFIAATILIMRLLPNSLHWSRTTSQGGIVTSKWFDLRPVIALGITAVVGGIVAQLRGRPRWKQYLSGLAIFASGTAILWVLFFRDLTR